MSILFIISTGDAETVYNAMPLANVSVSEGNYVSVLNIRYYF